MYLGNRRTHITVHVDVPVTTKALVFMPLAWYYHRAQILLGFGLNYQVKSIASILRQTSKIPTSAIN